MLSIRLEYTKNLKSIVESCHERLISLVAETGRINPSNVTCRGSLLESAWSGAGPSGSHLFATLTLSQDISSTASLLVERIVLYFSGISADFPDPPNVTVSVLTAAAAGGKVRETSRPVAAPAPTSGAGFQVEGVIRILLPVASCGAFMGKAGAAVRDFQLSTGSKCWLSKHTYDENHSSRVLMVVGGFEVLMNALPEVARRLASAAAAAAREFGSVPVQPPPLRFLLSNRAAGALIGRGGSGLKSLAAAVPGGKVSIGQLDHGSNEVRVVRISGDVDSICQTAMLVLERLSAVDASDAFLGDTRSFVPGYAERRHVERRQRDGSTGDSQSARHYHRGHHDDSEGSEEESDSEIDSEEESGTESDE